MNMQCMNSKAWCRILLAAMCSFATVPTSNARNDPKPDPEHLMVVDCLLPGKIRKLGQISTYITARRPIRTTAQDCEIRGGEYTEYDRANYATALKVWLPRAKEGDPVAANNVGQIFEKGLGLSPDYETAATWYQRAAEAGNVSAQINLGHLYEEGRGVDKDPNIALQWYRRASGMDDAILIDPGTLNRAQTEAENLREEVSRERQTTAQLQAQLQDSQLQLSSVRLQLSNKESALELERKNLQSAHAELAAKKQATLSASEFAKLKVAESLLEERGAALQRAKDEAALLRNQVARVEAEKTRYQEQLAQKTSDSISQTPPKNQLDQVQNQLAEARKDLERYKATDAEQRQRLKEAQQALVETRKVQESDAEELQKLEKVAQSREQALRQKNSEMEQLRAEIKRAEVEEQSYKAAVSGNAADSSAGVDASMLVVPSLEIIDPPIVATRGVTLVKVKSEVKTRKVVGRVTAPAGLMSLTVNDRPAKPNDHGVFESQVFITGKETPVSVVAVDDAGRRAQLEFKLEYAEMEMGLKSGESPVQKSDFTRPPLKFGKYHALLIGNNSYQKLPHLDTAIADVDAVEAVLRDRYQFETTVVRDANRYEILSALNKLRETLNSEDNLLVYYAGHGMLDEVNMRGHWLPVDAEPDNNANWISNVAITDILNVIRAKQIMLVVDSCYSGALTRSALTRLDVGLTDKERINWFKVMLEKRSRTVLTSGGLKPVLDAGGGGHSVFAKGFLDVLRSNSDIMEGQKLFREVSARVAYAASRIRFKQLPEYAPLQHAGHESGDFFLVPVSGS